MGKKSKNKQVNEDYVDANEAYSSMTQHEHILEIPDTYIGTTKVNKTTMFVYNPEYVDPKDEAYDDENPTSLLISKEIDYIGGLYKIFDEILVNATDHTVRDKKCKTIKIYIDRDTGRIKVWNDGTGIPAEYHIEDELFIPHMIFGKLLTSGNYKAKRKLVGGKNGFGAKLANIYSNEFIIRTIGMCGSTEKTKGKKVLYEQTFADNMYTVGIPTINGKPIDINDDSIKARIKKKGVLSLVDNHISQSTKTYTEFEFLPDYDRFGMTGLTADMYDLMIRRCYDAAACTSANGVKVYINDELVKCSTFKDYIKMFHKPNQKVKMVHEKVNSRWEIGASFVKEGVPYDHKCVSFVNGISTFQGGVHERHVINNIVNAIIKNINSEKKYEELKIKPQDVKEYIMFYVNCQIEDPSFGSQTKEIMTSKMTDWTDPDDPSPDARCNFSDDFIEALCKTGLKAEVVAKAEFKENRALKQSDGKRTNNLNIEKLTDAKFANKKSALCSMIFSEGDSANNYATAGLSVIGSDYYGTYPVGGKILNVRKATVKQIMKCQEFINIKHILGLKQGVKYTDVKQLRYGSIIILTDQDADGAHIKGLIINMFEFFWPELLKIKGFIKSFNTYVVKAWKKAGKKQKEKIFYTVNEFEEWKKTVDMSKWKSKYYKGLGTSKPSEAKQSFENFDDAIVEFVWEDYEKEKKNNNEDSINNEDNINNAENEDNIELEDDEKSNDSNNSEDSLIENIGDEYAHYASNSHKTIEKVFGKNADVRKSWVKEFNMDNAIQYSKEMNEITYSKFLDEDLILFTIDANVRAIPRLNDGVKPSQRMIIYSMLKRGRKADELKVAQLAGYVSENTDYHHGEASLEGAIKGLAHNYPGSNNINLLKPNGAFGSRNLLGADSASPRYIFTCLDKITNYILRIEDDEILTYREVDGKSVEPETYEPIIPMALINGASGIGMGYSTTIPQYNPADIITNIIRMIDGKEPVEMTPWFNGFKNNDGIQKCRKKNGDIIPNSYMINGKYTVKNNTVHITEIPVQYSLNAYENIIKKLVSQSKDDNKIIKSYVREANSNYMDMTIKFKGNELQKLFSSGKIEKFLGLSRKISFNNMHLYSSDNTLKKYNTTNDILKEFYCHRLEMYEKRRDYKLNELRNTRDINRYKIKYIKEIIAKEIIISDYKTTELYELLESKGYPKLSSDYRSEIKSYDYITRMSTLSLTIDKVKELENQVKLCEEVYDDYFNTPVKEVWRRELKELQKAYKVWKKEWEEYNEIYINQGNDNGTKGAKGRKGAKGKATKTVKGKGRKGKATKGAKSLSKS